MPVGFPKPRARSRGPVAAAGPDADHDRDRLATSGGASLDRPSTELSTRELEVLRLVAVGLPDKQVAEQLGISQKTVRNHLTRVYGKLGAGNRVEAVVNGLRIGLLSL